VNRRNNSRSEESGEDLSRKYEEMKKEPIPSLGRGQAAPPRKWSGNAPGAGSSPSSGGAWPRSQSFSVGHGADSFTENQMRSAAKNAAPDEFDPSYLASMDEEMSEEDYARAILDRLKKSRSQSSAQTQPGSSPGNQSPLSSLLAQRRGSASEGPGVWRGAPRGPGSHVRTLSSSGPPPGLARSPAPYAAGPDSLQNQRRFSLAPGFSVAPPPPAASAQTSTTMKFFGGALGHRGSTAGLADYLALRRHSLAGPAPVPHTGSSSAGYKHLSDALDHLQLEEFRRAQYGGLAEEMVDEYFDPESRRKSIADVGKGVPLSQIPTSTALYIVEFKAGRSDLFYAADTLGGVVKKGDLVIVEADRGKDLGKVVNDSITPVQVQQLQQQQAELLPDIHRGNKELHPKRIYRLAQPGEVAMLVTKSQDELKALQVCQTKVRQKKLPMEVVDAEYQWDRRKLTFYFVADRRIDFRELVRELFKIYKTRIWMCAVNPAAATGPVPSSAPKSKDVVEGLPQLGEEEEEHEAS
jgi:cell fate regulator YaaT (PSP1 superfamily)